MKKILYLFVFMFICIFSFVGCDCNETETEEAKMLRLHDLNQNQVIDDWEKPFGYDDAIGVICLSRDYLDTDGKAITNNIVTISDASGLSAITNTDVNVKQNTTLLFDNGTFFERSKEQINVCTGFRAYIVKIYTLDELKNFATQNLFNPDNTKYILSLQNDISFRTSESTGDPLKVFGKTEIINLNGAALYGNGKTLEGFKFSSNALYTYSDASLDESSQDVNKYDSIDTALAGSYVNLKYALISNASAVYDINVHIGYNQIVVNPKSGTDTAEYNMIVDVSPFRNVEIIDNVAVRGKVDLETKVYKGDFGVDNTNIKLKKVNVSFVTLDEDELTSFKFASEDEKIINTENTENNKYDYDRIINTDVIKSITPPQAEGEKEVVTYTQKYTHGEKLTSKSVSNIKSNVWVDYREAVRQTTSSSVIYFDPTEYLNIGAVFANDNNHGKITNCNSYLNADILTASNIQIGATASNAGKNGLIENCTATLISNINSIGSNISTVGSVVGTVNHLGEVKNVKGDINANYNGVVVDEETILEGDVAINDSIAIGGVVGFNNGTVVNCYASGVINTNSGYVVTVGAIAGASENGVFIKNIASINAGIVKAGSVYSGTVVGSAVGGIITSCVVEYTPSITSSADETETALLSNNSTLSSPFKINAGLLYNQSYRYVSYYKAIGYELPNNVESLQYDSFYYNVDKSLKVGLVYAPKCKNCLTIDNTIINFEKIVSGEVVPDDTVVGEDEENKPPEVYVGLYINLGGYFTYRFNSSTFNYEEQGTAPLRYYNSSIKINNNNIINYNVPKEAGEGEANFETKEINFYSQDNTNNIRITNLQNLYTINYIRNIIGFNGFDKLGNKEIEIPNDTATEDIIKNIKINNINAGSYYSPNKFTEIQMDTDVYADMVVDTYEELQYILDVYLDKNVAGSLYQDSLKRKDLFQTLIFKANLFTNNSNTPGYNNYELNKDGSLNENRFERDEKGSINIYEHAIYKDGSGDSIEDFIVLGKLSSNTESENNKIYAFKKGNLTTSTDKDGNVTYNLPAGYEKIGNENTSYVEYLNSMEMMIVYRLLQVFGVNHVEVETDINTKTSVNSKTAYTVIYNNSNTTSMYILDTLSVDYNDMWFNGYNVIYIFYLAKTQN